MEFKEYTEKYNFLKTSLITHDSCTVNESFTGDNIRVISMIKLEISAISYTVSFNAIYQKNDDRSETRMECISINGTGFQLNEHTSSRITNDSQFQEVYDAIREQQIAQDLFEF